MSDPAKVLIAQQPQVVVLLAEAGKQQKPSRETSLHSVFKYSINCFFCGSGSFVPYKWPPL
jgi:hypothetical protein